MLLAVGLALGLFLGRDLGSSLPDEASITEIGREAIIDVDRHLLLYNPAHITVSCDVFGPTEGALSVQYGGPDLSFTRDGVLYTPFGQLGADGDPTGEYRVTCDADGVIAAPPLDAGQLSGGVVGLIAGVLVGGLGLLLLVVGLIMHLVGRTRR